ncbi:MAG: hypothetical protein K2J47_04440, partial [Ruminococcus sp.]|nr:hypothetical protein [Ruminococcus sp.]
YIIIFAIIGIFIIFTAIFVLIILVCTKNQRDYRHIKNKAEADGIITHIRFIEANQADDYEYYDINYSFTDIYGIPYNKNFKSQRLKSLKEGDKISVYYDIDNPNKCVTDYKLKADKNLWWQALLITSIIVFIPFIISFVIYYND